MSVDWRRLAREARLTIDERIIEVGLDYGGRQRIYVDEAADGSIRLWSVVAGPAALRELEEPYLDAWRRNRVTELVGFTIDQRGRMIGETWVPTAGLTSEEWKIYVMALATACDRFEYLVTGKDEA
jgi:hypothetical protein